MIEKQLKTGLIGEVIFLKNYTVLLLIRVRRLTDYTWISGYTFPSQFS